MNGSSTPRGGLGGRLWRAALELLYPARCAACDEVLERPDDIFCAGCALTLLPIVDACPRCGRPSPARTAARSAAAATRPAPCLGCLERPPRFAGAVGGFEFGGASADAIRKLKWGH